MTSQSPRIYVYKITFEEVPYYYYGVHKEQRYNEYYMGSPYTNKWCWKHYTPKKQILQFFEFTDEGWLEAQEIETRLIRPFYQTDKWCLNENCGGKISIDALRKSGNKTKELGIGIHKLSKEEIIQNAIKGGKKSKELGLGVCNLTFEQKSEIGRKNKELGIGIHALTKEQRTKNGKKGAQKIKENGVGIFALTKEQKIEYGRKGGKISGKMNAENKTGVCGRSKEKMIEDGKKGGRISGKLSVKFKRGIFAFTKEERIIIAKKNAEKRKGVPLSEQHKEKLRISGLGKHKGSLNGNYGKTWYTDGTKNIMEFECPEGFHKGYTSKVGFKEWKLTFEDGKILVITNLSSWCKENGYNPCNLTNVYRKRIKKHKDIISVEQL